MARSAGSASISHVGLSFRAGIVRNSCCRLVVLHLQKRLAEFGLWAARHFGWDPHIHVFFFLAEAEREEKPLTAKDAENGRRER